MTVSLHGHDEDDLILDLDVAEELGGLEEGITGRRHEVEAAVVDELFGNADDEVDDGGVELTLKLGCIEPR